jgi:hypothetical protein
MPDVVDEAVVWVDICTAHSFLASNATVTLVKDPAFQGDTATSPALKEALLLV